MGLSTTDYENFVTTYPERALPLQEVTDNFLVNGFPGDDTFEVRFTPWADGYRLGWLCEHPDGTSQVVYMEPIDTESEGLDADGPLVRVRYGYLHRARRSDMSCDPIYLDDRRDQ